MRACWPSACTRSVARGLPLPLPRRWAPAQRGPAQRTAHLQAPPPQLSQLVHRRAQLHLPASKRACCAAACAAAAPRGRGRARARHARLGFQLLPAGGAPRAAARLPVARDRIPQCPRDLALRAFGGARAPRLDAARPQERAACGSGACERAWRPVPRACSSAASGPPSAASHEAPTALMAASTSSRHPSRSSSAPVCTGGRLHSGVATVKPSSIWALAAGRRPVLSVPAGLAWLRHDGPQCLATAPAPQPVAAARARSRRAAAAARM